MDSFYISEINRPDGEDVDQPTFAEMKAAAIEHGLEVRYQPVAAGQILDDDAMIFGALLDSLPKPVLAYCQTGTRSATLWSLSNVADIK